MKMAGLDQHESADRDNVQRSSIPVLSSGVCFQMTVYIASTYG